MFCHYCGVLGYDLRHCSEHYAASKKTKPVEYQYEDWLKADNGRSRSPPRRDKDDTRGAESMASTDVWATEGNEMHGTTVAAARDPNSSDSRIA